MEKNRDFYATERSAYFQPIDMTRNAKYQCPECQHPFEKGTKYCSACGFALFKKFIETPACPDPGCTRVFGPGDRYCDEHGLPLVAPENRDSKKYTFGRLQLSRITEPDDLADKATLDAFFNLHKENFPEDDEREERGEIEQRIKTGSSRPHTHLLVARLQGKVVGGAIIEFYRYSRCLLLTYIFTDPAYRGHGIARRLLEDKSDGLPALIRFIEDKYSKKYGKPIRVASQFFETENPFDPDTPTGSEPIHFSDRLQAFYNLGAKRINFPYIQPPLGTNPDGSAKQFAKNLYLCVFPQFTGINFLFETRVLLNFLSEFYFYLKEFHPFYLAGNETAFEHDFQIAQDESLSLDGFGFQVPQLAAFHNALTGREKYPGKDYSEYSAGYLYLHEIPRKESPKLQFERACVSFELVVDENYFSIEGFNQTLNSEYCVVTHSFETDLFAYRYQSNPPYYTRCFEGQLQSEVSILFPKTTTFVSEGRREMFFKLDEEGRAEEDGYYAVKADVFLNFSYFHKSEIKVWHIVLAAREGIGFSEYDIIKLSKFFSGAQESKSEDDKRRQADRIRFLLDGEQYGLYAFFEKIANIRYTLKPDLEYVPVDSEPLGDRLAPGLKNLRTGIIQIDTDYCKYLSGPKADEESDAEFQTVLHSLYGQLGASEAGEKATGSEIEEEYRKKQHAEYVFEAYCGITLGIFDYARMGYEEVSDTLIPRSATTSSFLTINRGVLTSFGYNDSVLDSSRNSIGINPYLLVPSAVLAHNEFISIDAEKRAQQILDAFDIQKNREQAKAAEKGFFIRIKAMFFRRKHVVDIRKLEEQRREIQDLLNDQLLSNIFQYPTEKDIFEYGMEHRGINERIRLTNSKINQIGDLIVEGNNVLTQQYQFRIGLTASVIAILQSFEILVHFVKEYLKNKVGDPENEFLYYKIAFVPWLILVVLCVYILKRWYDQLGLSRFRRFTS